MIDLEKLVDSTKDLKILYVEDNKEARESTLLVLESYFNDIKIAVDGEDGFNKFQEYQFDLILTDINMPKLNGIQMIKKIRKINSTIPILILSAHNDPSFFMDSIKLGVEGYILKPLDMDQFPKIISKVTKIIKYKKEALSNLNFLQQYKEATNNNSIVSKTNPKGIITYANDQFCKISGYSLEELIGKNHNIVRHPDNPKSLYKEMWNTIKKEKKVWHGIVRNINKSGQSYYVKMSVQPILDLNGEIVEYICLRDDITDIMNPIKQLEDLVDVTKNTLAVMIKIEKYEEISRLFGITMAHKIEKEFNELLQYIKPKECEFERIFALGDGKFAFAKNKDNCKISLDRVVLNLKNFQNKINDMTIDIDHFEYDISIIICLAYGEDVLENLNYGITELEKSKKSFIIANGLSKQEHEKAIQNMETISMLKHAIEDNNIVSYFQPIINNATGKIEKYESLVRLIANDKIISPYFFLDLAKKATYYSTITNIVLDNSFKALDMTDKIISMNLSAIDIEKFTTREYIFDMLDKYRDNAHRVVFELLEDESVKDFNIITDFIRDVKKFGVKIAIDDFGAGFSNFERLLDYQPDILKIDGCLTKNIAQDNYSISIVETIIAFAKKQNIKIVAEYIENEEIFNILKDLGADYSQGYYFGKPEQLKYYENGYKDLNLSNKCNT